MHVRECACVCVCVYTLKSDVMVRRNLLADDYK